MKIAHWVGVVGALGFAAFAGACSSSDGPAPDPGCPSGQKHCDGQCVSVTDEEYGCSLDTCEPCVLENALVACSASNQCSLEKCFINNYDCDGNAANGCETELSLSHCGGCGLACPTGTPHTKEARCLNDKCNPTCEAGYENTDGDATNGCEEAVLFTSDANCPELVPKANSVCDQNYWASDLCRYAHPAISCTAAMLCVVPLDLSQTPYWQLAGDRCP